MIGTQGYTHAGRPSRDEAFERAFLADMRQLVTHLRGAAGTPGETEAFVRRIRERLAIGAERYGEHQFLQRDNLSEVEEETPDVAAYAMLELERLQELLPPAELADVRIDLVTAAAYAAIADVYVRAARRKLGGHDT